MMADKTKEQKAAWLDGYMAAAACVSSFRIAVGHEIDDPMNAGVKMVATVLNSEVEGFKAQMEIADKEPE